MAVAADVPVQEATDSRGSAGGARTGASRSVPASACAVAPGPSGPATRARRRPAARCPGSRRSGAVRRRWGSSGSRRRGSPSGPWPPRPPDPSLRWRRARRRARQWRPSASSTRSTDGWPSRMRPKGARLPPGTPSRRRLVLYPSRTRLDSFRLYASASCGLADELVPVAGIARQEPLVGEEDGDARRREVVLDRDERLLEVAQEAGDVADHEQVERAGPGGAEHRLPGGRPPGRGPAGRGHRPLEAGVDEPALARSPGPAARAGPPGRSCRTGLPCSRGTSGPPAGPPRRRGRSAGSDSCGSVSVHRRSHLTSVPALFKVQERRDEGENDDIDGPGASATTGVSGSSTEAPPGLVARRAQRGPGPTTCRPPCSLMPRRRALDACR